MIPRERLVGDSYIRRGHIQVEVGSSAQTLFGGKQEAACGRMMLNGEERWGGAYLPISGVSFIADESEIT